MFSIGPVSGRSLFQIHVEKILAAGRRYGTQIPLYLMTSPATHDETVAFFAANNRFGLAEEDLAIFSQGTMPAVDARTGELLLEAPGRLALGPDGHGGMLAAMAASGCLEAARRRGIEQLFYFQVDNPLVEVCGEECVGYHLLCGAEMTSQAIAKREPLEKVGNVVELDGRLVVIEYSDLPDDIAAERRRGRFAGDLGGEHRRTRLRHGVSGADGRVGPRAAVSCGVQEDGLPGRGGPAGPPPTPNAVKFERFIFDLMPSAAGAIVVEVDRRGHLRR